MEQQQKQPSFRRLDYHYIVMQAGFWAMFASVVAYQTALLLERGFTNGEAGLMTAVRCLAGIICQPSSSLWGRESGAGSPRAWACGRPPWCGW